MPMGMFDEIREWRIQKGGGKIPIVEQTLAEMEFSEACDALVKAEKKFNKLDATVRTDSSADVCKWFDALGQRYEAEKRVWELFCAGERTRAMGKLYLKFRESLFSGQPLKADA
jgi:hypothetical protein